jgi:hypothetical protein
LSDLAGPEVAQPLKNNAAARTKDGSRTIVFISLRLLSSSAFTEPAPACTGYQQCGVNAQHSTTALKVRHSLRPA